MDRQSEIQPLLEKLLGSKNVYFTPPEGLKMSYPAIKYELSSEKIERANNKLYLSNSKYLVTLIDPNPDTVIKDKIKELPLSSFNRHYKADNLNHYAYEVYF